jgi:large subunit ribosomal protein L29
MKFKELKALPEAELQGKLLELRRELMKENAQVAIGTVPKNPRKLRLAKKTVAKIMMILAQKHAPQNKQEGAGKQSVAVAKSAEAPKK